MKIELNTRNWADKDRASALALLVETQSLEVRDITLHNHDCESGSSIHLTRFKRG